MIGALLGAVGGGGVKIDGLIGKVVVPALIAPAIAIVVARISIVIIYRLVARRRPGIVTRTFRLGQIVSSGVLGLAHGTNDGQKTMGVISLALLTGASTPITFMSRRGSS